MLSKGGETVEFWDSVWELEIKFSVPVVDDATAVSLPKCRLIKIKIIVKIKLKINIDEV